ncbi:MAG: MATE family efflux transporter [Clostridia bacterium]|nr:MATE family efflux transporter [Clostridia bacterium]
MTADILSLAGPTMLEQLLQTAVQYLDTAMVGALGTAATAAVGVTTTVNWLVSGTISALGVGFLSYVAKALGAGEKDRARRASAQAVFMVLLVGCLATALTLSLAGFIPGWMQADPAIRDRAERYFFILYTPMLPRTATILFGTLLRAAGDTKTPMRVGILVNAVNVVLNFFFIYPTRRVGEIVLPGAGLGVEGAALASAIAFTVGGLCITVAFLRHPIISPRGQSLRPAREVLAPCLRVAVPNMFQRFGTSLGYVAFAAMINSLGEVSTAAHTIANTVESAFYIPGYGMQMATATLAGNCVGAGDRDRLRRMTRAALRLEVAMMAVTGGLLFLFAPQMMGIFSREGEVIALGATVLRMVALSEPVFGVAIVLEGILQGEGRTGLPFLFNILCMWGVRILGTLICVKGLGLGLVSAWACMICHNIVLCGLFLWTKLREHKA